MGHAGPDASLLARNIKNAFIYSSTGDLQPNYEDFVKNWVRSRILRLSLLIVPRDDALGVLGSGWAAVKDHTSEKIGRIGGKLHKSPWILPFQVASP